MPVAVPDAQLVQRERLRKAVDASDVAAERDSLLDSWIILRSGFTYEGSGPEQVGVGLVAVSFVFADGSEAIGIYELRRTEAAWRIRELRVLRDDPTGTS